MTVTPLGDSVTVTGEPSYGSKSHHVLVGAAAEEGRRQRGGTRISPAREGETFPAGLEERKRERTCLFNEGSFLTEILDE
jgi:hypothetical protein